MKRQALVGERLTPKPHYFSIGTAQTGAFVDSISNMDCRGGRVVKHGHSYIDDMVTKNSFSSFSLRIK